MVNVDITPEQSIAALKAHKENGQLKPEHIKALAELISDTRLSVAEEQPEGKPVCIDEPVEQVAESGIEVESTDTEAVNPELAVYYQEYIRLPADIKSRATWESITQRLLADDSEKLKLVQAMRGGGELFGIDAEGKALFKDKGVEPVMFGFDKEGKFIQIYDRDSEQMEQVVKWADYSEIRQQVLKDGYELFADDGNHGFGDEMKQVTDHTNEPFVASEDRLGWRASWLESGDKPEDARDAVFVPDGCYVRVYEASPMHRNVGCGAVRLLRV